VTKGVNQTCGSPLNRDALDLNYDRYIAIVSCRQVGEIGKATSAFRKSVFMKDRTRLGQGW
jgi:hypothetical protein